MDKARANEIMKELKENCKDKRCCDCVFYCNDFISTNCKLRVSNPVYYEIDNILDKKEKEYLSNIVKPFRDKVQYITKIYCGKGEYIAIGLYGGTIDFPYFKKGTMYKGMRVNRSYTLEELGI